MTTRSDTGEHPWVSKLQIEHFAAVRPGTAFEIPSLSPGINVLYGPNGSGKSTTARALRELIWNPSPSASYRLMQAHWRQADQEWGLRWEGTQPDHSPMEGTHGEAPIGIPENVGRYFWSLQDLIQATDGDLAARVAREMAGGVDFERLLQEAGASKLPSSPRALHEQYRRRTIDIREALQRQADLQSRASELQQLQEQQRSLVAQSEQRPEIQRLLELRGIEKEMRDLEQEYAQYPQSLNHATRQDRLLVDRLEQTQEELQSRLRELTRSLQRLGPGEEAWGLSSPTEIQEALRTLSNLAEHVQDCEANEKQLRDELDLLEIEDRELRKRLRLQDHQAEHLLEHVSLPEFRTWIQAVLRENRLTEEKTALELRLEQAPDLLADPETLRAAQRDLRKWLDAQKPAKAVQLLGFGFSYLLLIMWMLLYRTQLPPHAWYGLPVPLLIEGLLLFFAKSQQQKLIEQSYPEEAPAPFTWTPDAVRDALPSVSEAIEKADFAKSFQTDRNRLAMLEHEVEQATAQWETVQDQLFEMELEEPVQPEWAGHFLEDVRTWREQRLQLLQKENLLHVAETERVEATQCLIQRLAAWTSLSASTNGLEEWANCRPRMEKELERKRELETLRGEERHLRERLSEVQEEASELSKRLEVGLGNWEGMRVQLALLEEFEPIKQRLDVLKGLQDQSQVMVSASVYLNESEERLHELAADAEVARTEAMGLEKTIQQLSAEIEQATRGRRVHELQEEQQQLREQLALERERITEVLVKQEISEWLQQECRTTRRPEVLDAANHLLQQITRGALQLSLSMEKGKESFMASEPGKPQRSLDELSSGERVQVLMAVRFAFLEHEEALSLPLFVDEVLSTSDAMRSDAILHTLLEIAKKGRQVFVMTSQLDEVAQWKALLVQQEGDLWGGVPYQLLNLEDIRNGTAAAPVNLPSLPEPQSGLSRKEGETWEAWATRAGAGFWSPWEPVEELSLFYVMQDQEETLTRCLQAGIRTWGSLSSLEEAGAEDLWGDENIIRTTRSMILGLKELQKAWQRGRTRPLDPQELIDSGKVASAKLPAVLRILEQQQRLIDPFLEALDQGAVEQWGPKKTERLRDYFHETDRMGSGNLLSEDEIRATAMVSFPQEETVEPLSPLDWQRLMTILKPFMGS